MAAILIIEALTTLLNNVGTAPIFIIGGARGLEIILLPVICYISEPSGIKALGILPKRVWSGLVRGFLWSAEFGLMVGLVAVILMMAALQPPI